MSNIQTTFIKRTKDAKMNAGIAAIASKLAKTNNDILWQKSNRAKKLFISSNPLLFCTSIITRESRDNIAISRQQKTPLPKKWRVGR